MGPLRHSARSLWNPSMDFKRSVGGLAQNFERCILGEAGFASDCMSRDIGRHNDVVLKGDELVMDPPRGGNERRHTKISEGPLHTQFCMRFNRTDGGFAEAPLLFLIHS
jgi:hypothetical protein